MTKPKTLPRPPVIPNAAAPDTDTVATEETPTTAADLRAAFPELVATIATEAQAAERQRIDYIAAQACDFQAKLAAELVTSGASQDEALRRLHTDLMENGQARAEELVTAEPLGVVDDDPDGGAAPGPRAYSETSQSWEDQAANGPDYAACNDEEAVTAMAAKEFATFAAAKRKDLGGLRAFSALRRGEHHERVAAANVAS